MSISCFDCLYRHLCCKDQVRGKTAQNVVTSKVWLHTFLSYFSFFHLNWKVSVWSYLLAKVFGYVADDLSIIRSNLQRSLHQTFGLLVFLVVHQLQSQHGQQDAVIGVDLQGSAKLFGGWWLFGIWLCNVLQIRPQFIWWTTYIFSKAQLSLQRSWRKLKCVFIHTE